MLKIINLIKKPSVGCSLMVVILSLIACWSLFRPGYFSMHDNIQVMRLLEMEKCFQDGQIPCRWAPDMGAGFGYPLFNFYSVFPYYLGVFFRLFGLSYILIVKILFGLSLILSGVFMYFLAQEFFGELGAMIGAIFYVYAPYHAVDVYVRGALSESWAITFFPLIFLSVYKYIKEGKLVWYLLSVLSLALLLLSHNIMSLLFVPLVVIWAIFWLFLMKKRVWWSLSILLLGIGLTSFYLIPAFFEKSLVNMSWLISDYFDFRNHFVSWKQLFIFRSFGYGPSILGPNDTISFQLGWIHWLSVVFAGVITIGSILRKSKKINYLFVFFGIWLFSIFMTHAKSVFIWEAIPLLSFVQFPWRFLGVSMFAASFLAGGLAVLINSKLKLFLTGIIILMAVILNIGYFRPEFFYFEANDQEILSGESWKNQSRGALLDYLPKTVQEIPEDLAPDSPWVVEGEAKVTEYAKRSNFWRFTLEGLNNSSVKVKVPVFDFPVWTVLIDQNKASFTSNNPEGVIEIAVPPGKHTIVGWFEDTPIRSLANWISMISLLGLILLIVVKEKYEKIV